MNKVTWLKMAFLMASTLSLMACGQHQSNLHQWVAKEKNQPEGHITPIPKVHPYQAYHYPSALTRNPFNDKVLVEQYYAEHQSHIHLQTNRRKQYLENFPLDSLKMVGTLTNQGILYALIQTPDGLIHWVHIGDYLGEHDGKILAINGKGIHLREIVANGYGGYKEKMINFPMSN